MSSANDRQVGGTHYGSTIQHWDMVVANRLGYFEAQVTKYISRSRKKNGRQDVEKGLHFLDKLIEVALKGEACPAQTHLEALYDMQLHPPVRIADYAAANGLEAWEAHVCGLILEWIATGEVAVLQEARAVIAHRLEN